MMKGTLNGRPSRGLTGLRTLRAVVGVPVAAVLLAVSGPADAAGRAHRGGVTVRVSVDSAGGQGSGWSAWAVVSADGRFVAFLSDAPNLVSGDTNGVDDVFVRDLRSGVTRRVSVSSAGEQANGGSRAWSLSDDGRYVTFTSSASNLVPGDANGADDAFVHDLRTAQTRRVSVASDGAQADGFSTSPRISGDGRVVAFYSWAPNLVAGDTNGAPDVFTHDLRSGVTRRVSVASDGSQLASGGYEAAISADGRFVAFSSDSPEVVPGDTNGTLDVFRHDRRNGTTTGVSLGPDGQIGSGPGGNPSISANGRYVAFKVYPLSNPEGQIYVADTRRGTWTRVTEPAGAEEGRGEEPSISPDGRYVAFVGSSELVGDSYDRLGVMVRDLRRAVTVRVSLTTEGQPVGASSPNISRGGRVVVFWTDEPSLVPDDTNGSWDVFAWLSRPCLAGRCGH